MPELTHTNQKPIEKDSAPQYYYNGPLENSEKHGHLRVKIGVSGAAETGHCGLHALEKAQELGKEIIRQGGIFISGATTGFPFWAAMGAKSENGISIGLSPAESEAEHLKTYRLPVDYMDIIVYTGFGFPGRDLLFTRSCDAVILGCGRIGTIHEFTIAFEDGKPIGILEGPWPTAEDIKTLIKDGNRPADHVVFDDDPKRLVQKVIAMVEAKKKQLKAY
jgi:uncharacterized protein (TIGR00725 family)